MFIELIDGFDALAMSLIMPLLQLEFNLSPLETEYITSAFFLGMMIGAFLLSMFAD